MDPTVTTRSGGLQRVVAALLRAVLRTTLRPAFSPHRSIADQRRRIGLVTRLTLPARGVEFTTASCNGVAGEYARPRDSATSAGTVLYLHGGAYCLGSPATHRAITSHLARRAAATVFAADYRLAPEHPFPAALEDAVAAYRGLLAQGCSPARLALVGDSAGGGLALALALRLRQLGEPLPAALVLLSPLVDLGRPDRGPVPDGEVIVSLPWIEACARHYLGAADAAEPLASPIHGDLHGLPPVLLQVGTDEILLQDSQRLHQALTQAGVAVELQTYPRRWHVFQASAGVLADADLALGRAAQFLRQAWRA